MYWALGVLTLPRPAQERYNAGLRLMSAQTQVDINTLRPILTHLRPEEVRDVPAAVS